MDSQAFGNQRRSTVHALLRRRVARDLALRRDVSVRGADAGRQRRGPQGGGVRDDAQIASATFVARRADSLLDVYRTQAGTYVGADVSQVEGVELVRTDATSYCLKIRAPGRDLYEQGPGGDVSADPC